MQDSVNINPGSTRPGKSDQEDIKYFSLIDFAVDCYAYESASLVYLDNSMLRNCAVDGYMLTWRGHFLEVQEEEEYMEDRL